MQTVRVQVRDQNPFNSEPCHRIQAAKYGTLKIEKRPRVVIQKRFKSQISFMLKFQICQISIMSKSSLSGVSACFQGTFMPNLVRFVQLLTEENA